MSGQDDREVQGWLIPEQVPEVEPQDIELSRLSDVRVGPEPTPQFIDSIRKFGVVVPIVVRRLNDGKQFEVIDGKRRAKAAIACEMTTIPARVYDEGFAFSPAMTVTLNNLRSSNPVSEFEAIERMLQKGASEREIARATGLSIGTVRKRLKLAGLLPELQEAFRRGEISTTVAERVATLPKPAQERLNAIRQDKGKLTGRDVSEAKEVARQRELGTIPMEVFESRRDEWYVEVANGLIELKKLVPASATAAEWIRELAERIMETYGGEKDASA